MVTTIESVDAMEVLDSRGNPTVRAFVQLENGVRESATVPSGASTGSGEALELRDVDDSARYRGKGVRKAVENVTAKIGPAVNGLDVREQRKIDQLMIDLDSSPNKENLGANAILAVSMAIAKAAATSCSLPLYRYLGGSRVGRLPVPMVNVLNGGEHASNDVDIQEFMLLPVGASSFADAIRWCAEIFGALRDLLIADDKSTAVGDEGGFAPDLESDEKACQLLIDAIREARYAPGKDVVLALDVAASELFRDGKYKLRVFEDDAPTREDIVGLYESWVNTFHIASIEDGFDEKDWLGFQELTKRLGDKVQIVGDDLYVTNTKLIQRGIDSKASNAVLIKLNQIGTVSETIDAVRLCQEAGWNAVVSHRSGETEDTFLADFAVAMDAPYIKTGSVCRSERLAKYNRLLEIERELGTSAVFGPQ